MKEYLYDGSFDGLLTAVFYSYKDNEEVKITKEHEAAPHLFIEPVYVKTEADKAERVYQSLYSKLSYTTLSNVYYLYLSEINDADTLILEYIKLCFSYSDNINLAKNNDIIRAVDKYVRKVYGEAHFFKGILRFKELRPLVFYAQIEPDHNILPLIMNHFRRRFSDQHFIIHDLKREYAAVYNLKEVYLKDLSIEEGQRLLGLSKDDMFETLFKSFYESVTIKERLNERQRRSFMPRRYWKHLVEL